MTVASFWRRLTGARHPAKPKLIPIAQRLELARMCLLRPEHVTQEDRESIAQVMTFAATSDTLAPVAALIAPFTAIHDQIESLPKHPVMTKFHALALRERERSILVTAQETQIADAMAAEGLTGHFLRGPKLARRIYPDPLLRHSHAVRVLVENDQARAHLVDLVKDLGWTRAKPELPHNAGQLELLGSKRVTVSILGQPFLWHCAPLAGCPWDSAAEIAAEVMTAAHYEIAAKGLRWVLDMVFLARAEPIDADAFAARICEIGTAGSTRRRLDQIIALLPEHDKDTRMALRSLSDALPAAAQDSRDIVGFDDHSVRLG